MRPLLLPLRSLTLSSIALSLACGGGGGAGSAEGPIKVGAIFDLTGATSDVGTTYSEGIRAYVDWLNQSGGLEGRPVRLVFQDYGYKVDLAEQLYSQFVHEGVVAFMGWGTGDTEALRGRVADDRMPFASASFSHVLGDPDQAPYNFLLGTSYSDQLVILLDWIAENDQGGTPVVALMHHASPFGLSPYEQGGRDHAASKGIRLVAHEMSRGSTDYTAELTRIRESGARYVVFQNTSGPASVALKNARDLGLEATYFCLNWCTNEVLTRLAGGAAEGVIGSVLYSPPGEGVSGLDAAAEYLSAKGGSIEQKGLLFGQGWTMMSIMLEGVRRTVAAGQELTGENIKAALESIQGFETGGVTPPITFGPDDHRGMRGMRLYRVEGGVWRQLTDFREADW
ncbi:MAG TPA: ABC transporter substrate-binding protein [Thermoanaerobaculia bacterium]|nr:ABC transporter substrate-binding protein [Thermoanaerobaculia bacterium]